MGLSGGLNGYENVGGMTLSNAKSTSNQAFSYGFF